MVGFGNALAELVKLEPVIILAVEELDRKMESVRLNLLNNSVILALNMGGFELTAKREFTNFDSRLNKYCWKI